METSRAGVADPGNAFDMVGKPLKDMVLIQQYDAVTKERGGGCDYGGTSAERCMYNAHDINNCKFRLEDTPKPSRWVRRGFSSRHPVFRHLDTFDELRTSAQTCRLCRLFLDDFGSGADAANPDFLSHLALYETFLHSPCAFVATWKSSKSAFWYKGQWEPHEFRIVQNRPYDSSSAGRLQEYEVGGRRLTFDRAVPESARSRDPFDTARHWLKDCTGSHSSCARLPSKLPTRVVEIGVSSHNVPRIHVSNGETTPYEYTLIGLPVDRLPQNFLDAISVTRELGLRYVWIDAICIIQDSPEDWFAEAAKMASYYSGAVVTISVLDAVKSTEGFLDSPRRTHVELGSEFSVCKDPLKVVDVMQRSALDSRGWCLQERLLSPALLHFGREQMVWEPDGAFGLSKQDFVSSRKKFSGPSRSAADFHDWYAVVEDFSSRDLTVKTDKFPAIAGVAYQFRSLDPRGAYVAGLWEEDLVVGLFWGARPIRHIGSQQSPLASSFSVLKKTAEPQAPSWSWANVDGPIEFRFKAREGIDCGAYEVLAVNMHNGYDDPMEAKARGGLRIRAFLARVQYNPSSVEIDIGPQATRMRDTRFALDFERDHAHGYWMLSTSVLGADGKVPGVLLLEEVPGHKAHFRRVGHGIAYRPIKEDEAAHFDLVDLVLI
ncbi:hypothetical protein INS49_013340 [Diaporthe citri]|uniref:uncharacterized protein n=1 Tax=Diaporthe citri TaxID=83186 RepID=UPI001C8122BC|nr:uncharacterized protein INS49_013340 [Diaporthe citri]KAG6357463.1 hypothetical protein INS49_013340 [Diaporthe citri]